MEFQCRLESFLRRAVTAKAHVGSIHEFADSGFLVTLDRRNRVHNSAAMSQETFEIVKLLVASGNLPRLDEDSVGGSAHTHCEIALSSSKVAPNWIRTGGLWRFNEQKVKRPQFHKLRLLLGKNQ